MENITNLDNVIDSRDIISRIAELESEQSDLMEAIADLENEENHTEETLSSLYQARADFTEWEKESGEELDTLRALASEAEGYGDWEYGETLIHEGYFTEYAQELAEDCGDMPKDLKWPFTCIDWDQAARELKYDYTAVDFDGQTYLMRA